ncbi:MULTISPECIES: hypothetical protein [Paenibacillus]|uniref:hypothetical protein n=1 Tax=Paenibacillus TaxID=44249 RepID=UPI00034E1CC7|nr:MULTISPECIES: hypothetical protein [Paenibacillus]EPD85990.1 hypothetical protein HMPREF1207_02945 [Paenibacillus sp. HGH0039]
MVKTYRLCFTFAAILLTAGCLLIYLGFDKKFNYYSSEKFTDLNRNAYVGGDAYNYIINSNYFTGYGVLGCSAFICATMFFCTALYLRSKDQERAVLSEVRSNGIDQEKIISHELPPL